MTQVTQSIIIMQEAIVTLYTADEHENKKEKLKEAAEKVLESKKKLQSKLKENKRSKRKQDPVIKKQDNENNDGELSVDSDLFDKHLLDN